MRNADGQVSGCCGRITPFNHAIQRVGLACRAAVRPDYNRQGDWGAGRYANRDLDGALQSRVVGISRLACRSLERILGRWEVEATRRKRLVTTRRLRKASASSEQNDGHNGYERF